MENNIVAMAACKGCGHMAMVSVEGRWEKDHVVIEPTMPNHQCPNCESNVPLNHIVA